MNMQPRKHLVIWLLSLVFSSLVISSAQAVGEGYEIEIIKSRKLLLVKQDGHITRKFSAATGKGGKGDKTITGDRKTPVGTYRIVSFNDNSRFHYFMQLNYPNVKDAFFGLKKHLISRDEFDQIIDAIKQGEVPPQNTKLGGQIGIHGIGEVTDRKLRVHRNFNWTEGCIALTNEQISELKQYVDVGTRVVINE